MSERPVMWVEIASELRSIKELDIEVGLSTNGPIGGKINDKPFVMSISNKENDGLRPWMVISLAGQDPKEVIPPLTKFMGYHPFCHYGYKKNKDVSVTYEWDKNNPEGRSKELLEKVELVDLKRLDEGFKKPSELSMDQYFANPINADELIKWEEVAKEKPDAELVSIPIVKLIPLLRKLSEFGIRFSKTHSVFGPSIICLGDKLKNEKEIVEFALKPFLKANLLSQEDVDDIIAWFNKTPLSWDSGNTGHLKKIFTCEGIKYRLITDSYRNYLDLNLNVVN